MRNVIKNIMLSLFGLCSFVATAQRYVDHEVRLLHPSEQFMFVKGYYSDTLQLIYTNLGPDTVYERVDTLKITYGSSNSPTYPRFHVWSFPAAYTMAPNQSMILKFHFDLELAIDIDELDNIFKMHAYSSRENAIGIGILMPERQEHWYNSGVLLYFNYRSATSSVSDLHASALNIWPNPANDQLHIDWPEEWESQGNIVSLYNTQGALLHTEALEASGDISVSHLPAGLYVLELRNKEAVLRKKVLVVR